MTSNNRLDVNCGTASNCLQRYHFKFAQDGFDFGWLLRLNGPDHNILSAFPSSASLVDHAKGLTDTRGVAENDLEPPPSRRRFLLLAFQKQLVRSFAAKAIRHRFKTLRLFCRSFPQRLVQSRTRSR